MNAPDAAFVEFISASTAGVVNVELGFIPDFAIGIFDHGGTNPNVRIWLNGSRTIHAGWAVALDLLITGSTGVITRDTTGMAVFAGGTVIATVETANSDPKHVHRQAGSAPTFAAAGRITQPGLSIPADHQVNSGRNLLWAIRGDM